MRFYRLEYVQNHENKTSYKMRQISKTSKFDFFFFFKFFLTLIQIKEGKHNFGRITF